MTLEVLGRRSGLLRRFPLGMARLDGRWYLVSMLGEQCNWVQNVRASRPVTVTLTARRDGPVLQAAGSIPVQFARWGIRQPAGFGPLGSLADNGDAEFLLILHRE